MIYCCGTVSVCVCVFFLLLIFICLYVNEASASYHGGLQWFSVVYFNVVCVSFMFCCRIELVATRLCQAG